MSKENWLKLMRDYPVAFGVETGFTDLKEIHNEWIKDFLYNEGDLTLQAHRGSYKTTCLSIAMALMVVIYPNQTAIFLRKTDDDVKTIMLQVSNLLQTDMFQGLSHALYGVGIELRKESVFEIDTNLHESTKGAPQLSAMSLGGSLTGQHADVIITDDIITLKDRVSRASREHTKLVYQELENIKNRNGRFINTGTPWHKDDAFQLMENIKKFDVYSTGLVSENELYTLRDRMSSSLFSANYELKHIADEMALFRNPKYTSNEKAIFDGVAHIDSAYGGGDGTAFTIAKKVGNDYIVFGKLWKKHVDDCMDEILEWHKHYRAGTIYNELNADKGYLAKELEKKGYFVGTYHEAENKYIKIATILRREWGNIYFLNNSDPEYISEILDFTENAENDDAPDSLASLIRAIENTPKEVNTQAVINNIRKFGL